MVENWQRTLLLLSLQHVVDGATSDNLKRILVDAMVLYGGLIQEMMAFSGTLRVDEFFYYSQQKKC